MKQAKVLSRVNKLLFCLVMIGLWGVTLRPVFSGHRVQGQLAAQDSKDSEELKRLSDEDQRDRNPANGS